MDTQTVEPFADQPPVRSLREIGEARLSAALDHWRRLIPDGADMPLSDSYVLTDVPEAVVPHLATCTWFLPDGRMRVEFVGSVASMFLGTEAAGRYVDELYPPHMLKMIIKIFAMIERLRAPLAAEIEMGRAADGLVLLRSRRLYLPLADEAGGIVRFANVIGYDPTAEGRNERVRMSRGDLTVLRLELFRPVE